MTATELLTNLMDKTRQITGLTEKISVAQLTDLMSNFVSPNLLSNSSGDWKAVNNTWQVELGDIPAVKGDTFTASVEVKDASQKVSLVAVYLDKDKKPLKPYGFSSNGDAQLENGNIANSYILGDDGFFTADGLRTITVSTKPNNCAYVHFRIAFFAFGNVTFRKPMIVRGTQIIPWTFKHMVEG